MIKPVSIDLGTILGKLQSHLSKAGIDLDLCDLDMSQPDEPGKSPRVKVVCVGAGLKDSVEEMARAPRDQVVMVRVDEGTTKNLDDWVETGAVKSRSEAAALFIREGLKVRSQELSKLRGALRDVEQARERLKDQAREVFGDGDDDGEPDQSTQ